jgi:spore coat polysaccharide biosynthesis protein SpsF
MDNVHIIVQARMNSSRLPGKILKELCGLPMLYHIVERCRRSKKADRVIVATSVSSEDDAVVEFCKENGTDYFRGSEDDVLERYYQCARQFKSDVIVRICADNPFADPLIIDFCIERLQASDGADYIRNSSIKNIPPGINAEVFYFRALEHAYKNAKEPYEREHVTPYIWENKQHEFKIGTSIVVSKAYEGNYRLTVDYPEDFEMIRKIYKALYKPGMIIDVREAIIFLDKHPEIPQINAHRKQKSIST